METIESKIDAAVTAVCPVESISFPRRADKSTWIIKFRTEATAAQRAAAQTVIANFDLAGAIAKESADKVAAIADSFSARADNTINTLAAMTPAQAAAWVEANVNTFADQKAFDKTIAKILCVLARRL